jgi:hypothetical protein
MARRRPTQKSNIRSRRAKRSSASANRPANKSRVRAGARNRATYDRALHALALMRKGESLAAACRAEHIKPQTLLRHVGNAVRHDKPGGRYRVARTDTLRRDLEVQTPDGPVYVSAKGIKVAREFADHANAIAHFNRTGDESRLKRFKGKTFKAGRKRHEFLTDPDALMVLADADALPESLYTSFTGR